jgi:hypothetical protein
LKPCFNESGQSSFLAPKKRAARQEPRAKQQGRVMATVTPASLPSPAARRDDEHRRFAGIRTFWRQFFTRAFDPYRPELHYMRGPGPACRAMETALSPAVQSMLAEIRSAKALKSSASL